MCVYIYIFKQHLGIYWNKSYGYYYIQKMEGSHMQNCSCCSCVLVMKSSIQKIIEIFVKEGPSSYCFKSVVHIILCYIRLSINFLINKEVDFISQHLLTSFRITRFYIYFCKQQGFESNKLNVTTVPCLIQVPCPRTHGCASLIFMEPEGGEKARNDTLGSSTLWQKLSGLSLRFPWPEQIPLLTAPTIMRSCNSARGLK